MIPIFTSTPIATVEQSLVIGVVVGWVIGIACMKILLDTKRGDMNDHDNRVRDSGNQ